MIQRKQTLWLLLASIAAFSTLKFSFYTGNIIDVNGNKIFAELNARFHMMTTIFAVAVAILSLVTIFLYNDRKKQMNFSIINMLLSLLTIGLYFWQKQRFVDGAISLSSILVFVVPVFIFLALRGIYKDEKLIKSVDRLR